MEDSGSLVRELPTDRPSARSGAVEGHDLGVTTHPHHIGASPGGSTMRIIVSRIIGSRMPGRRLLELGVAVPR